MRYREPYSAKKNKDNFMQANGHWLGISAPLQLNLNKIFSINIFIIPNI